MNDFLDTMPLVIVVSDETLEKAAYMVIGELLRRDAFLAFVRTPCEGEVYRAPEYR